MRHRLVPRDRVDGHVRVDVEDHGLGTAQGRDVGHHDDYSSPRGILPAVAHKLAGLPAYLVGVRCPDEEIVARRDRVDPGHEGRYAGRNPDGSVPDIVRRWDRAVHDPGIYDLEVDTSRSSPAACAAAIADRIGAGPPTAFAELARR